MFFLALPSLTELLYGISLLPRARMNLEVWQNLQDSIILLDMQRSDAEFAARVVSTARFH